MRACSEESRRPVLRAARLLVLALTLAGFVAMHGLAATDGTGTHWSGHTVAGMAGGAHQPAAPAPAAEPAPMVAPGTVVASAPTGQPDGHELMSGCLLALLGALAALALRLLATAVAGSAAAAMRLAVSALRAARAPPRPLFVSLCVYRL